MPAEVGAPRAWMPQRTPWTAEETAPPHSADIRFDDGPGEMAAMAAGPPRLREAPATFVPFTDGGSARSVGLSDDVASPRRNHWSVDGRTAERSPQVFNLGVVEAARGSERRWQSASVPGPPAHEDTDQVAGWPAASISSYMMMASAPDGHARAAALLAGPPGPGGGAHFSSRSFDLRVHTSYVVNGDAELTLGDAPPGPGAPDTAAVHRRMESPPRWLTAVREPDAGPAAEEDEQRHRGPAWRRAAPGHAGPATESDSALARPGMRYFSPARLHDGQLPPPAPTVAAFLMRSKRAPPAAADAADADAAADRAAICDLGMETDE